MDLYVAIGLFNALMLGVDAILTLAVWRLPAWLGGLILGILHPLASLVLSLNLVSLDLATASLWAWGLFAHWPAVMLLVAWLAPRRQRLVSLLLTITSCLIVLIAGDAFLLEPRWLEVTHYSLESPKIQRPVTIVVLADFQTDHFGNYERQVLRTITELRPDLVLCAGDYLQPRTQERFDELCQQVNQYLHELNFHAPRGVFAVQGNSDDFAPWQKLFDGLGVQTFDETETIIQEDLAITGLSMTDSFLTELTVPPASGYHIVLGHAPDFALGKIDADLLVAGHTHGGQVRLPCVGPLITMSAVPRAWAAGLTRLSPHQHLVVSRGVGMERNNAPRLRFLCRPELVVLHLQPAATATEAEAESQPAGAASAPASPGG